MTDFPALERGGATPAVSNGRSYERRRWIAFAICITALLAVFAKPLVDLLRFAFDSALYSHAPLIPLVSAYLVWSAKDAVPAAGKPALAAAISAATAAAALLVTAYLAGPLDVETSLSIRLSALVLLLTASVAGLLGVAVLRYAAFPLGFLVFMIPLPSAFMPGVELFLQHGSAGVARALFKLVGTPLYYNNLIFELPGISIRVAPECSGIHSTLALLIVSVLAGHWFLRSAKYALLLSGAVLPLALIRNGVRVFTIGELCVYKGPQMIDSPIHRQGGPLFFAASLVPFLAVLWLLVRAERHTPGNDKLTFRSTTITLPC